MKEINWQSKICDVIRSNGGYAKKWASMATVGVPDLVTALPGVGGVLMEVKVERGWNTNTSRQLNVTPLQKKSLIDYKKSGGSALVVVVVEGPAPNTSYIVALDPPAAMTDVMVLNKQNATTFGVLWRVNGGREVFAYIHDFVKNQQKGRM